MVRSVKTGGRLTEFLRLFESRNLRAVALFGNSAHELADEVRESRPDLKIFKGLHPALLAMNRQKGNRERFAETFRQIRHFLDSHQ